jgi:outer membrane protein TolC
MTDGKSPAGFAAKTPGARPPAAASAKAPGPITLWDYFAAAALSQFRDDGAPALRAADAAQVADLLLRERAKRFGGDDPSGSGKG